MMRRSLAVWASLPNLRSYDVCVIGAGPAGLTAALHASNYGKKVCLIEKDRVGGADLWDGALQSKTLWQMSKFNARAHDFGAKIFKDGFADDITINEDKVQESLTKASELRMGHFLTQLKASNVDLIFGKAAFQTAKELEVTLKQPFKERKMEDHGQVVAHHDASKGDPTLKVKVKPPRPHFKDEELNEEGTYDRSGQLRPLAIRAEYFIIATGSVPRPHPDYHVDGEVIVTSDHIMKQSFPKSIVIIGAGVIGCEFASIYANLGKTHVNIIEKTARMLPMEDADLAGFIQDGLTKKGVRFHHQAALHDLDVVDTPEGPRARYAIKNNVTGEVSSFEVEKALLSIGRVPNYSGLGLEMAGCSVRDGKLQVDQYQRCLPHNHIYAVGDATVDIALVNVGETEAVCAIDHIYKPGRQTVLNTDNLSTIMFLDQAVAAVGLNEQQCKKQNIAYLAAKYSNEFISRAVAMGSPEGFIKIIVTNDFEKTVLGVRAVGVQSSSIVELASLAIHNKKSVYDLFDMVVAYPAMTQGFQECLRMLIGRSTLKPNVFPGLKTWEWTPNFAHGRAHVPGEARPGRR